MVMGMVMVIVEQGVDRRCEEEGRELATAA
jgi:hypothetical protein